MLKLCILCGLFHSFWVYQDRFFRRGKGLLEYQPIYNGLVVLLYGFNLICSIYFFVFVYTTLGFIGVVVSFLVSLILMPILVSFLFSHYSHLIQAMVSFVAMPLSLFLMGFNKLGVTYVILVSLLLIYVVFYVVLLKKQSTDTVTEQSENPHLVRIFYDNGCLKSEVMFLNDKMYGELKLYDEKGKIKLIENYENGIKNGKEVFYYENGQVKSQGNYQNGKKNGLFQSYSPKGELISETIYQDGTVIENKVYKEFSLSKATPKKRMMGFYKFLLAVLIISCLLFLYYGMIQKSDVLEFNDSQSSLVNQVNYSLKNKELQVKLRDRGGNLHTYIYEQVPAEEFQKFSKAKSKGKFFNQYIKNKYDFERIN